MRGRLFPWFRRADARGDVADEVGFHLEMRERELCATGMDPAEARRRAREMFGDVAQVSERCVEIDERGDRSRRVREGLGGVAQDVRYALRTLRRSPGFALSALAMLALGIGANSTLFTLVDAVVLRPLAGLRDVDSLVEMSSQTVSFPTYRDLGGGAPGLAGLAAFGQRSFALGYRDRSQLGAGTIVTGSFFTVLGGRAQQGRLLEPSDDDPAAPAAVVLSDACWRRLLGADPAAVGRELLVNGRSVTIVGVAAPGFSGPRMGAPDLWMPIHVWPRVAPPSFGSVDVESRDWSWLRLVGRLAPGVSMARAESSLNLTADRLRVADPRARLGSRLRLTPVTTMATTLGGGPAVVAFFGVLVGVVTLVLLITCANVANLLLARATRRRREIAVRLALGASRGRLIRQLLTESLVLALLASALGLGLTLLATSLLDGVSLPGSGLATLDLHLDWRLVGFTLAVSLATGLVFGLAPALQATRPELVSGLKAAPGPGGRSRLRGVLLTGQVALSLVLLVGAGLFARALQRALTIDPGFQPRGVAMLAVDPGLARFEGPRAAAYFDEAARRVRALPGVVQATWTTSVPLTDDENVETLQLEGYTPAPGENMDVELALVGADLPATLGMPVVAGRAIGPDDAAGSPPVAMVNETLARRYFPSGNAIGNHLRLGRKSATIVGVVRDIKTHALREEPRTFVYLAHAQQRATYPFMTAAALLVRTSVPPRGLLPSLERELRATAPEVPVFGLGSLDDVMANLLLPQRLGVVLLGGFSLLAVLVAALGIFGVVAYGVSQRSREIGIRMALGAGSASVLRLVLGRSLVHVGAGIALGLVLAAVSTRVAQGFLYGIPPTDLPTFVVTAVILLAASVLAAYLPARGATRTNPATTLRSD